MPCPGRVCALRFSYHEPSAAFNSQQYIYMTREEMIRYNAAVLAHQEITDYFKPYAEFYFMDDKSHQVIAPAALFQRRQSARSDGSRRLLHQLQAIRC